MIDTIDMLVVDDNTRTRQALIAFMTTQAGIRVIAEASNGQDACTMVEGQVPDIVLMDVRMPVMDGVEATRCIKESCPEVKIVLLSIYPDYQEEALAAGADAFIVKGCPLSEMMLKVHELLETEEDGFFHPE